MMMAHLSVRKHFGQHQRMLTTYRTVSKVHAKYDMASKRREVDVWPRQEQAVKMKDVAALMMAATTVAVDHNKDSPS